MSVPLDRLYDFIDGLCNQDILIYRWFPHGSKKLEDLGTIKNYYKNGCMFMYTTPILICHDQEPFDFNFFSIEERVKLKMRKWQVTSPEQPAEHLLDAWRSTPFRDVVSTVNVYDYTLLLHSEKNSNDIEQVKNEFIPVYYWSHAIIARDWFRYAEIDTALTGSLEYSKDFLIYNRAWSGTREYRLKFAELIIKNKLYNNCSMGFSVVDNDVDYRHHIFKNSNFKVNINNIEEYFFKNTSSSAASADYNREDYNTCRLEVVLETLFDDDKIFLTEKILRPIACGKPFILVSTPNSLKYLHSYGFKTFNGLIDESYDSIQDPVERLNAIVKLMLDIANMPVDEKTNLIGQMSEICQFNRTRFFSKEFIDLVTSELKRNLDYGIKQMNQHCTGKSIRDNLNQQFRQKKTVWANCKKDYMSKKELIEICKWLYKHNYN